MRHDTDWKLLQTLAEDKRDRTARELGQTSRDRDAARSKLQLLLDYRRDYQARLDSATRQGIDGDTLRNYRAFLANLERAIEQQTNLMASAQERVTTVQKAWRDDTRKVESFRVLDGRQAAKEADRERRREQKTQDEIATQMRRMLSGGDD